VTKKCGKASPSNSGYPSDGDDFLRELVYISTWKAGSKNRQNLGTIFHLVEILKILTQCNTLNIEQIVFTNIWKMSIDLWIFFIFHCSRF
jgi:hypothetical protein